MDIWLITIVLVEIKHLRIAELRYLVMMIKKKNILENTLVLYLVM